MNITDLFIRRPVLATVVSLMILLVGLRSLQLLNVAQYPKSESAVVYITTVYVGADAELVKGFITTLLEREIASADGIDYIESSSVQGVSSITAYLELNYPPYDALTQIQSKINRVRADLPADSEEPVIELAVGQTTAAMYLSFLSKTRPANQITDYLVRIVQPRLEAVAGVQRAAILFKVRELLHHIYGPEGVRFFTRVKTMTSRWPTEQSLERRTGPNLAFPSSS